MKSIKNKIFYNVSFLILSALLLSNVLVAFIMYKQVFEDRREQVKIEATNIKNIIEKVGTDDIENNVYIGSQIRLTVIEEDGTVIYDSEKDPADMDNHSQRPEIMQANSSDGDGTGESFRFSKTLGKETFYYAVKLESGSIVRVAYTTESVFITIGSLVKYLIVVMILALFITLIVARRQTKKIIVPINKIDLDDPLENDVYEELIPLLHKIDKQNDKINEHIKEIKEKQDEFNTIVGNMTESLILLDNKARILSINKSALDLFSVTNEECINQHILTMSRNSNFNNAVISVEKGDAVNTIIELDERYYKFLGNPIEISGKIQGAVLLILDITEQYKLEEMRKEFSANVSHELKTPLMTISGYAEIMKNGMVKSKDIPEFSSRIFNEAHRLKNLVEDVIKISQLDENNIPLEYEDVNLINLANGVKKRLEPEAKKKNIKIEVIGEEYSIHGVYQILDEIFYNLVENAIKYNKEDGSVTIMISKEEDNIIVCVKDTGIGIPKEHQSRIFERFYRVDKSHYRESGGTGLGLSIVKHGAAFHHAKVKLESIENKGTKISVIFNLK